MSGSVNVFYTLIPAVGILITTVIIIIHTSFVLGDSYLFHCSVLCIYFFIKQLSISSLLILFSAGLLGCALLVFSTDVSAPSSSVHRTIEVTDKMYTKHLLETAIDPA